MASEVPELVAALFVLRDTHRGEFLQALRHVLPDLEIVDKVALAELVSDTLRGHKDRTLNVHNVAVSGRKLRRESLNDK